MKLFIFIFNEIIYFFNGIIYILMKLFELFFFINVIKNNIFFHLLFVDVNKGNGEILRICISVAFHK